MSVQGEYLYLAKTAGGPPTVYLHCRFATLKYIENLAPESPQNPLGVYHGIKIIKGSSYEEILCRSKPVIDKLFDWFSMVCIHNSINTKYTQVFGLGKGAFCKVFQARRNR